MSEEMARSHQAAPSGDVAMVCYFCGRPLTPEQYEISDGCPLCCGHDYPVEMRPEPDGDYEDSSRAR